MQSKALKWWKGNALKATLFPSSKEEGKKKEKKNHTYADHMQYGNIKFLLWNCCQVRHFIKNYNRVSMTACLNAEKGPSNSVWFKSQHQFKLS